MLCLRLILENEVLLSFCTYAEQDDVPDISVSGTIDRPLESAHPRHPEMIYPINSGYVNDIFAGDGTEQDMYVFGTDQPINTFSGKVVGVYHRLNDNEDKYTEARPIREDIHDDMKVTPPGIDLSDKYYFGFFDNQKLVAIMDIIDGYPKSEIAYIGFFMMNPQSTHFWKKNGFEVISVVDVNGWTKLVAEKLLTKEEGISEYD